MGKCQCTTGKHKQCSRNAKESSQYCFQHQSCKVPIQKSERSPQFQKPFSPPKPKPIVKSPPKPKPKPEPIVKSPPKPKPEPIVKSPPNPNMNTVLQRIRLAKENHETSLDLSYFRLINLPVELFKLSSLTRLDLNYNQLVNIPKEIGQLSALTELYLYMNQLVDIPKEIGQLSSLTYLNLNNNRLEDIPKEIGQLSSLTTLYLSHNKLLAIPKEICQLSSLTTLYLGNNQLVDIPKEIGQLSSLTKLYLNNNKLTSLPIELIQLKQANIYYSVNPIKYIPPNLLQFLQLNHNYTVPKPVKNPRNLINLSGPQYFAYYPNILGRRVLLLGESHSTQNICPPTQDVYEVQDWLWDLTQHVPSEKCLDIMVEHDYTERVHKPAEVKSLVQLKNYSAPLYAIYDKFKPCHTKNIQIKKNCVGHQTRYHFTDPRVIDGSHQQLVTIYQSVRRHPEICQITKKHPFKSIIEYLLGMGKTDLKLTQLNNLFEELRILGGLPRTALNGLDLSIQKYHNIIDKLAKKIDPRINAELINQALLSHYMSLDCSYHVSVLAYVMFDQYTLFRLFSQYSEATLPRGPSGCQSQIENCIIYSGQAHSLTFFYVFKQLFSVLPDLLFDISNMDRCLKLHGFDFFSPNKKPVDYTAYTQSTPVYQKLLQHFDAKMINHLSVKNLHELDALIGNCGRAKIADQKRCVILDSFQGRKRINNKFNPDQDLKNLIRLWHPIYFVFLPVEVAKIVETYVQCGLHHDPTTPKARKLIDELIYHYNHGLKSPYRLVTDFRIQPQPQPKANPTPLWMSELPEYQFISMLGQGGFGEVVSAKNMTTGDTEVIKRINKSKISKKNFMRELNALQTLKEHCELYLLCYHSHKETKNNYYIISEVLNDYYTLDLLSVFGRLDLKDHKKIASIKILTQNMRKGLKVLHQLGWSHRDIKPTNILFNKYTSNIKYIDFGLMCDHDEDCKALGSSGTPHYMAPEVASTSSLTLKQSQLIDLWALGVTIYELMTGKKYMLSGKSKTDLEAEDKIIPFLDLLALNPNDRVNNI
jgi:hypothetical protein